MAMLSEKEVRSLKTTALFALNELNAKGDLWPDQQVDRERLKAEIRAYKLVLKE
jgi:hypothetical protein